MTPPDVARLFAAMEATWPAAETIETGGWRVRRGAGGGGRVSAATGLSERPDIAAMEAAQAAFGQPARVMIRSGDPSALDAALAGRGYRRAAPTRLLLAPAGAVAGAPAPVTAFLVDWPPLAVQREIWADAGIGPERLAVMARAAGPRTTLLGRQRDRPGGTAFAALSDGIAMVHALTVRPATRRAGLGRALMQAAAGWALAAGGAWLAVQVEERNSPARAFFAALGMAEAGRYHYRTSEGARP